MRIPLSRLHLLAITLLGLAISGAQAEIRETSVWWLPRNVNMFGHTIDFLFYVILILTGVTFIGVFSVLVYFLVKYRARPGVAALHSHGNNTLEVVWTTIPVFIFLGWQSMEMSSGLKCV